MYDFTLKIYQLLLEELQKKNFNFITFSEYISSQVLPLTRDFLPITSNIIEQKGMGLKNNYNFHSTFSILRHDVDRLPANSLATANIEYNMHVKGTYYFRIVPDSYDQTIMENISRLGHEIGYHYEDVDLILKSQNSKVKSKNGDIDMEKLIDLAFVSFCKNLEMLRKNFDIKTICMHGSPLSKYDNKIIWEKYNYKELELIGEPYFDIDWSKFGYFTDTGRRWDGVNSSVRDKVNSTFKFRFKSTQNFIKNVGQLPDRIMITVHPQRWNDNSLSWMKEYVSQNLKNIIKKYFYVKG